MHPEIEKLWAFLHSHPFAKAHAARVVGAGTIVGMLVGALLTALYLAK